MRQCGGTGTICGRIMSDVVVEWHVGPGPRQLSSPLTLLCIDPAVVRPGRPGGVITISALNCSSYHTRPHHTAATLLLLVGINHSCLPRLRGGREEGLTTYQYLTLGWNVAGGAPGPALSVITCNSGLTVCLPPAHTDVTILPYNDGNIEHSGRHSP